MTEPFFLFPFQTLHELHDSFNHIKAILYLIAFPCIIQMEILALTINFPYSFFGYMDHFIPLLSSCLNNEIDNHRLHNPGFHYIYETSVNDYNFSRLYAGP